MKCNGEHGLKARDVLGGRIKIGSGPKFVAHDLLPIPEEGLDETEARLGVRAPSAVNEGIAFGSGVIDLAKKVKDNFLKRVVFDLNLREGDQEHCGLANRLVPQDHGSIAALRELGKFAVGDAQLADRILRFLKVDAPIFRCEVDRRATEATGDLVTVYQPSDRLNAFLAALRAGRGRDFDEISSISPTLFGPSADTENPIIEVDAPLSERGFGT